MIKINIFIDQDGVLAQYDKNCDEKMYNKGFFQNLPVQKGAKLLIKKLMYMTNNIFLLSKLPEENPHYFDTNAYIEKQNWLDINFPEITNSHRIILESKEDKGEYIKNNSRFSNDINILYDDFTENLENWEKQGENFIGIKILNGINNSKGTWVRENKPCVNILSIDDNNDISNFYKTYTVFENIYRKNPNINYSNYPFMVYDVMQYSKKDVVVINENLIWNLEKDDFDNLLIFDKILDDIISIYKDTHIIILKTGPLLSKIKGRQLKSRKIEKIEDAYIKYFISKDFEYFNHITQYENGFAMIYKNNEFSKLTLKTLDEINKYYKNSLLDIVINDKYSDIAEQYCDKDCHCENKIEEDLDDNYGKNFIDIKNVNSMQTKTLPQDCLVGFCKSNNVDTLIRCLKGSIRLVVVDKEEIIVYRNINKMIIIPAGSWYAWLTLDNSIIDIIEYNLYGKYVLETCSPLSFGDSELLWFRKDLSNVKHSKNFEKISI